MFETRRIRTLSKVPGPLLTAYLKTSPEDRSLHPPVHSCLAWLKKEAGTLAGRLAREESEAFLEQLRRLEEFLRDRTPRERSVVVFAGPRLWEAVGLQVEVENELQWGKAAVTQLLWLAAEHKLYGIVSVDRSGAQIFSYRLGEMSRLLETKFEVDISQWKKKDRAHVARPGIRETHGAQRDVFDHRMDAQYRRLSREVAEQIIQLSKQAKFSAVFLAGPERLTAPIAGRLPTELFPRVVWVHKDLGRVEPNELQKHLEPEIEKWEETNEATLVNELLGDERGAVAGIEEVLAELQSGAARTVTVCRDLDARVYRCDACGYTSFSADRVCSVCRGVQSAVALREALPELAAAFDAEIEVVSGEAAAKLKQAGGAAAWLRQPRRVLTHV